MAPTFLQKLAKVTSPTSNQQNRDRVASDSTSSRPSGRLSIGRNRSPSASIKTTSGSNASTTNITSAEKSNSSRQNTGETTNDIPSINILDSSPTTDGHVVEHQGSFDTISTQPNVTIIPPSPLVGTRDLDSDSEVAYDTNVPPVATGVQTVPSSKSRTTTTAPKPPPKELDEKVNTTPTQDIQTPINSPISPATTITPTKTTTDVQDKETNKMSTSNSPSLREQKSNKSLKSGKKAPPADLHINPLPPPAHHRAATAPAGAIFPTPNGRPETDPTVMNAIAESPTELIYGTHSSSRFTEYCGSTSFAMELSSSPPKGLGVLQPEKSGSILSLSGCDWRVRWNKREQTSLETLNDSQTYRTCLCHCSFWACHCQPIVVALSFSPSCRTSISTHLHHE
jgi:hypothetical protein